ncbi:DUF4352 domain-containing protein [Oryzobacter sp. R7]|uniref:DUF4352 domain-containing protein n=1 Tax=Oryzobacter faecalis TaxID=3388656 RepID=UPI00398C8672
MTNTPAGWYPQADGRQRYWDGTQWTEHFAPGGAGQSAAAGAAGAVGAAGPVSTERPWFKKKRFIIPGALVGLIILGSAMGGADTPSTSVALASSSPSAEASTEASAEPAVADSPTPTPTPTKTAAKPAPAGPKIGSKARDGKFEFVVTGVKCGITTVGSQYLNTKAQGEFCRLAVKITNIGDKAQSMFADNQLAFDAKKREFSASSEASFYDEKSQVLWEEINPGNTVDGRIYFDVPKGTKLVTVELHDSMFSGGVEVALKK